MKERPILFNSEMVKAILEGRKTQTRRVIKSPKWSTTDRALVDFDCPYGWGGDRLWVKETWGMSGLNRVEYKAFPADGKDFRCVNRWQPSIHMSRKYSRITLKITEIRVERLQEITFDDCRKEGVKKYPAQQNNRMLFLMLWNSLNKKYPWLSNPWLWVISFRRIKCQTP